MGWFWGRKTGIDDENSVYYFFFKISKKNRGNKNISLNNAILNTNFNMKDSSEVLESLHRHR